MITKEQLEKVGTHILEGMTERESAILADVSWAELQETKESSQNARDFLDKKTIEFKSNHLKEIQKNKSEKNSQWLLEKLRPDEFGSRVRPQSGPTINIIGAIIRDIQNEETQIVGFSRGARVINAEESGEKVSALNALS